MTHLIYSLKILGKTFRVNHAEIYSDTSRGKKYEW